MILAYVLNDLDLIPPYLFPHDDIVLLLYMKRMVIIGNGLARAIYPHCNDEQEHRVNKQGSLWGARIPNVNNGEFHSAPKLDYYTPQQRGYANSKRQVSDTTLGEIIPMLPFPFIAALFFW